jgi:hypothetical protein
MHPTDELTPILKKLRLSGVLQTLDLRMRQAVDDDLSLSEFLLRLLTDEVERRGAKQSDSRLRRASFEHHRTRILAITSAELSAISAADP